MFLKSTWKIQINRIVYELVFTFRSKRWYIYIEKNTCYNPYRMAYQPEW
jgi:hypothetical protein